MRTCLCFTALLCSCLAATATANNKSNNASSNTPPEGFTALFNGEDLSGWIGMRMNPRKFRAMSPAERTEYLAKTWEKVEQHWSVEDGVLVNDGHGPYLTTAADFGDFELRLQYKTVAGADSGIYLRGVPQVQIWDATQTSGSRGGMHAKGSGGLFNNKKHANTPLVNADKPFGQWNDLKITLVGETVSVVYNGKLVVNEVVMENYWDRSIPIFPVGPIQLQTHGGEIRFRNIYLRKIDRRPPESGFLDKKGHPFGDGWTPLSEDTNDVPAGDVEYHLLFTLDGDEPAEFSFDSENSERKMSLTLSPEAGATLTAQLSNGKAFPLAHTPAVNSGLKESGQQHLYARIRGNSIQAWLNGTPIVDVLSPHQPEHPEADTSGVTIQSGYVRSAKNDHRVEMFPGGEKEYTSLFNGKNLDGWIGGEGYRAEPNVLVATKHSGNILTKEPYDNFRFRFEFKLRPGGNNGVGLRVPLKGHPSYSGIECQILDNTADRFKNLHNYQYHGSLYGMVPAKRGYQNPVGHWNQEEIIVDGDHFTVILNGKVIVDANLKKAAAGGTADGKEHAGPSRTKGHIGFLGHGHLIEFRNLRIKRLE